MNFRITQLLLAVVLGCSTATAELRVAALFSDSMVLQQSQPLKVWGWAASGDSVRVEIAGQSSSATATETGQWQLQLDPLSAGGPYVLTVSCGNEQIRIDDILVGEVWLCSGQSNMAMTVNRAKNFSTEAAAANFPKIRMFKVESAHATEPQETCQGQWTICSPDTVGGFSATGYFFGRRLHQELNVPIGLINSSVGGTSIESWTSLPAQSEVPTIQPRLEAWIAEDAAFDEAKSEANFKKAMDRYDKQVAAAKRSGQPVKQRKPTMASRPRQDRNYPSNLFNGKINPLIGYAIKGAIWYQGENSSSRGFSHLYGDQLQTLINDWRARWGQGDFPFAWVQLPNFRAPQQQPAETNGWTLVQEGMLKSLSLPHTGMAVTIDVGDAKDIHPKDKQSVGHRLAQWTLADVYGKKIVPMGPIYRSSRIEGDKVVIEFDHATGLKSSDEIVSGFAICGDDRVFLKGNAVIDGETVIVSSPSIARPVAVRYAWAANPVFSLYNAADIPASPFRTDNWEERGR